MVGEEVTIGALAPVITLRTARAGARIPVLALLPFVAVFLILFALPIVRMLSYGFLEPRPGLGNFTLALSNDLYLQVILTTLRIAIEVTIASILLAYPVASFAVSTGPLTRNIIFALVLVPFWTSLLVRVYGWTFILQRTGVINEALQATGIVSRPLKLLYTEGAVIVGITHYMLPFMIFTLYVALRSIDPRLRTAAATLGARPLRIFLTVTLPMSMPGLVAGSVLVFIGTLGFYVTPALLGSPSEMMLANLITFQVKDALDWPMASTIASLLMIGVASLGWVYLHFLNRTRRGRPA